MVIVIPWDKVGGGAKMVGGRELGQVDQQYLSAMTAMDRERQPPGSCWGDGNGVLCVASWALFCYLLLLHFFS